MNLRTKLLLGIGIALIVTFTLVAAFSYISMEKSFRSLEAQEVNTTITRAQSSFHTDQRSIESVTRDYAAWTDTYQYALGQNPSWEETNTGNDFFQRFGLYGLMVLNRSGAVFFSTGYNSGTKTQEDIPLSIQEEIRAITITGDRINATTGSSIILAGPDGPYLVSTHPILTDNFEGPGAGTLNLIRRIDDHYLADISSRTGKTVAVISAREVAGDPAMAGIIARITPGQPVVVVADDTQTVSGYSRLDSVQTPGAYYLRVSEPRTIYQEGQETIFTFIATLGLAGVFIIAFVLLFIDRIVLSRLNAIIGTVRKNTAEGQGGDGAAGNGADELARLALEIDPVFTRLAESRVQLQQSEERYRTLAESAQDFIYIINMDDRIEYLNQYAASAVGRSPEELVGKPRSVLFPAAESGRQLRNIRHVLSTGEPSSIESNLPLPEGERWIDTLLVPLRDRNNVPYAVMGITRDITGRKRAEEALFQANKKLNLLSSITRHDILNQLTALRTYLELSLDIAKDPEMIDLVRKEQSIAAIIDQQITFTRDYQQMGVKAPVWQDLGAIVPWTIQPLSRDSVTITVSLAGIEVFADPMLEKVFYNLVDNALKYGGERLSRVTIAAAEDPEGLVITVGDDGPGVTNETKERIFERGFGRNTGFGLFLSREILGITGMTIREIGTYGSGALLEIRVPKGAYRFTSAPGKS